VVLTAYLSKTIACTIKIRKKVIKTLRTFAKGKPDRLKKILCKATAPLRDTAAVNATRYAIGGALKDCQLVFQVVDVQNSIVPNKDIRKTIG